MLGLLIALAAPASAVVPGEQHSSRTSGTPKVAGHHGPWGELSNGCRLTQRGRTPCDPYLGAAVGGNTDPAAFEAQMKGRLGTHRVYWRADQVDSAIRSARKDLASGRLPWMSFKLPYSWADMAAGRGDAWARDLASRLNRLPGPVWIAFHHEPEGDGPMADWKAMQEHLAPIVHANATNVAFTVILIAWEDFYGDPQYRLDKIWPDAWIQVAGFDIYNRYLVTTGGFTQTNPVDLRTKYFEPIQAWAKQHHVRWGLAETGYSHPASERQPHWIEQTYRQIRDTHGIAMTYFDSTLNSVARWDISTTTKKADFATTIKLAPTLPRLD